MLWYLKQDSTRDIPANAQGNRDTYFYISKNEHTIGRGECTLTLPNDQSVSRKHAAVWIENGQIKIKDLSSRYGTFVNPDNETKAITANEPVILQKGQKVRFGMQWNVWELHCIPIATVFANMSTGQKQKCTSMIQSLNGSIENDVNDNCTHITTDLIYLTFKLLWGLVKGLPIVTSAYWKDCAEKVKLNKQIPDSNKYVPPVGETILQKDVNLDSNQRRQLFKEKVFLFTDENGLKKLRALVEIAGGKCELLSDLNDVVKPNTLVIHSKTDVKDEKVVEKLKDSGKRIIPEHEIALAIWYSSCSTHCNPDHKLQLLSDVNIVEQNDDILVHETQLSSKMEGTEVTIPATQEQMEVSSSTDITSRKRVIDDYFSFEVPKRQKIEVKDTASLMPEKYPSLDELYFNFPTNKRKAEDLEDAEESKSKRQHTEQLVPLWKPSETNIKLDPEILENIYNVNGWITKSFVKLEIKDENVTAVVENGEQNGETSIVENGEKEVTDEIEDKKDVKNLLGGFQPIQVKILPSIIVKTEPNGAADITVGGVNFKKFKKVSVRKASSIIQAFTRRVCDGQQSKCDPKSEVEDDSATTGTFGTESQFNIATPCA